MENRVINRLPSEGHVVTCDLRFISEAEFSSSDAEKQRNRGGALASSPLAGVLKSL